MPYTPQIWSNSPSSSSPINATRLNHIEDGIKEASDILQAMTIINVKVLGAKGDGVTDDSDAIKAAQDQLGPNRCIYFPPGKYRVAKKPTDGAALVLAQKSYVSVVFDPSATLLMDNLETVAGKKMSTSSGVSIHGKAEHITIVNYTVDWKTRPEERGGHSNGLRAFGYPSDGNPPVGWIGSTGKISHLTLINPTVHNSGEAGILIYGVSDPKVIGSRVIDTLADGLHFNACRRINVNNHHAENVEDDGIAFVCYYHPSTKWEDASIGPFWQSELSEWTNSGVANNVVAWGERANGLRIHMAKGLIVDGLNVYNKWFVMNLTTAKLSDTNPWQGIASEDIIVSNIRGQDCNTGILFETYNIDGADDEKWWRHKNVIIQNAVLENMGNWSMSAEGKDGDQSAIAGLTIKNIKAIAGDNTPGSDQGGHGGVRLCGLRDCVVDGVELDSNHKTAQFVIQGASQFRTDHMWTNPSTGVTSRIHAGYTSDKLPSSNLVIDNIVTRGCGAVIIQDISGLNIGKIDTYNSAGVAVSIYNASNTKIQHIGAYRPGRTEPLGRGAEINRCYNIDIQEMIIDHDNKQPADLWQCFEIGGGDADHPAGGGIRVEKLIYTSTFDRSASEVAIQAGQYAPFDVYVDAHWLHKGETSPKWRSRRYGPQLTGRNPAQWLNIGPAGVGIDVVNFNDIVTGGVYAVAGSIMNNPGGSTHNQPGNTGLVILTVTVLNPNDTNLPLDIIQEYVSADSPKLSGQRRWHSGTGWTPWATTSGLALNIYGNGNYTLPTNDDIMTMGNTTPSIVTVPPNSTVSLPVGTRKTINRISTGEVSILEGAGVFIGTVGGKRISAQFGEVYLTKYATDSWLLTGNLKV